MQPTFPMSLAPKHELQYQIINKQQYEQYEELKAEREMRRDKTRNGTLKCEAPYTLHLPASERGWLPFGFLCISVVRARNNGEPAALNMGKGIRKRRRVMYRDEMG